MLYTLQEPIKLVLPTAPVRGERGGQVRQISDAVDTLGQLIRETGGEATEGRTDFSFSRLDFVVRHNPDITTEWKVVHRQRVLDIKSVSEIGGTRRASQNYTRLICEAPDTDENFEQPVVGGPNPVYFSALATQPPGGNQRQTYDVSSLTAQEFGAPAPGATIPITGNGVAGQYLVYLFPYSWGVPVGYFVGDHTSLNQIGAFRSAPATLTGSTSAVANNYRALISLHRKATTGPINDKLQW